MEKKKCLDAYKWQLFKNYWLLTVYSETKISKKEEKSLSSTIKSKSWAEKL